MKKNLITVLSAIALTSFVFVGTVHAEDANKTPQSHEEHHPDANAPVAKDAKAMSDQGGMMEKMDMGKMQGMMHECMEKQKDGKMCVHSMMDKCQEKMGKGDCQKMMKQARTQDKKNKK